MAATRLPDVVVIVLDTARTFDTSVVWPDCPTTTPTLERLAGDSLVFPCATAPAPWTLPSHASLFTGLMPSRHGAHEISMRLAADGAPTMAELLGAAGYLTVGVCCNDLVSPATGLTRGYERFVEQRDPITGGLEQSVAQRIAGRLGLLRRRAQRQRGIALHARDHGGRRATDVVETVLRSVPKDRPLHLFVNYLETHLPYLPSAEHANAYLDGWATFEEACAVNQSPFDHITGRVAHGERDWALLRSLYRGSMLYVDSLVARVLDMLRDAGRYDGALLVITSDHGENIGDHGQMDHQCSLHDSLLRVPLLVRVPGGAQRGRSDDLVQLTDVLPTVCEVAGISAPPMQGSSLLRPVTRTHAIAEYLAPHVIVHEAMRNHPDFDWSPYDRGLRSVRTATRKYISASDGRNEFYDVERDPYERENLFGGHPDELALARVLRRWEQTEGAVAVGGHEVDPAITERLAALGYIE